MKKIVTLVLAVCMVLALTSCKMMFPQEPMTSEAQNESEPSAINPKMQIPGTYCTNDWNGKAADLILYEDGTCLYPNGANGTWTEKGQDKIEIRLPQNDELITEAIHTAYIVEDGIKLHDVLFKKQHQFNEENAV